MSIFRALPFCYAIPDPAPNSVFSNQKHTWFHLLETPCWVSAKEDIQNVYQVGKHCSICKMRIGLNSLNSLGVFKENCFCMQVHTVHAAVPAYSVWKGWRKGVKRITYKVYIKKTSSVPYEFKANFEMLFQNNREKTSKIHFVYFIALNIFVSIDLNYNKYI